ncbi:DUF1481 domain-containing protein [Prodigiosinella confusarubida]|uniref:DUF1481 domain-containing protein n=1 Tax=Serratia sp. (strain ATCC 39006) TaxID=104623 RepID=A0A2I5TER1_SERS3|nr:DUF1481 domain-containing protein [Serratia sp. ATCC 39006]AUG98747.1 DUF1481 domain-containing protein [Serratia sp. ATCC 39006]AUH03062.1 DUF1481 domain-containing protein [Serratia sp. ATCC 39006]
MLGKGLNRGANMPLLFFFRSICIGVGVMLMTACSSHSPPSDFYAGGYLADRGVVRLWRKDDVQQHVTTLMTVYSPHQGQNTQITHSRFQQGTVREIQQSKSGPPKEETRLRFDANGTVSYMQRQFPEHRESLSEDEIALYQFDAKRMLELSDALRVGNIQLKQGIWQNNQVMTCNGQLVRPDLDRSSLSWIAQRRQHSTGVLSIAWLESPEGSQLLLVVNTDFCRWEPTAKTIDMWE